MQSNHIKIMRMNNPVLTNIKFIYFLTLLTITCEVGAQSWPMPGAKWHYCITSGGKAAGFIELSLVGDTSINNILYSIITKTADSSKADNNVQTSLFTLFTRYSNDTVYRFVNNKEYIFFVFSSITGDFYTTFRSAGLGNNWNDSACTSRLPLQIIENSNITYNNLSLRRIVLQDTLFTTLYQPNFGLRPEYTLIERIGVLNSLPLINSVEPMGFTGGGCSLPSDWDIFNLGAYSDDDFNIVFESCKGVGIDERCKIMPDIEFYPNPCNSYLTITHSEENMEMIKVSIFGIMGDLRLQLLSEKETNTRIDISTLQDGYYILVCQPLNQKYSKSVFPLIIKH